MPQGANAKSTSILSSLLATVADCLKPHRAEALQRIRINGLCLAASLILSYLLPVPSLPSALRIVIASSHPEQWSQEWMYEWICILEVAAIIIFAFNVLEGVYAVKYPRAPLPPTPSPAKPRSAQKTPASTPQRPFRVLSPNSSPQPQKAFAFSPSSSFSSSSFTKSTTYPASPISTPSRVMHYSVPPTLSPNTLASSVSTMGYMSTPSPIISAYRGKHFNSVGRALDGSYVGLLAPEKELEDES